MRHTTIDPSIWCRATTPWAGDPSSSDLLWNNGPAGVLGIWLMKDGQIAQTIGLNHDMPGWSVAGIGNFNHDGTSDIMWRNAGGVTSVWIMKDGQIAGTVGTGPSAGWTPSPQGDFDHNGASVAALLLEVPVF